MQLLAKATRAVGGWDGAASRLQSPGPPHMGRGPPAEARGEQSMHCSGILPPCMISPSTYSAPDTV